MTTGRRSLEMTWSIFALTVLVLLSFAPIVSAFHLFRGNENELSCDCNPNSGGSCFGNTDTTCAATGSCCSCATNVTQPICCPAIGELGETVSDAEVGAEVLVLHNSFNDETTLVPAVVTITEGQAVRWKWASSHCHSVQADDDSFNSGFFYPKNQPAGQDKLVMGGLDYPLPDPNPSLTYTHKFNASGAVPYHCVHHQIIGMEGVVIVQPAGAPYP